MEVCPYCFDPRCFQDYHHTWFPKSKYRTPLERKFRERFKEKMWRCQHDHFHLTTPPPTKPFRVVMQAIVGK